MGMLDAFVGVEGGDLGGSVNMFTYSLSSFLNAT